MNHPVHQSDNDQHISPFELFISALSVLSIINMFMYLTFSSTSVLFVIGIIDLVLSVFFLGDFLYRLFKATSKSHYMFKEFGWADLLASIPLPQFKILRIFRLIKAYKSIQKVGGRGLIREFFRNRASSALYLILFLIILLLEFASVAILSIEGSNPAANIHTASDAIWWVYVTITTVGYGDRYPVTNAGRLIGMFVMLAGVGLFGILTGFLANKFLPQDDDPKVDPKQIAKLQSDLDDIKQLLSSKS